MTPEERIRYREAAMVYLASTPRLFDRRCEATFERRAGTMSKCLRLFTHAAVHVDATAHRLRHGDAVFLCMAHARLYDKSRVNRRTVDLISSQVELTIRAGRAEHAVLTSP